MDKNETLLISKEDQKIIFASRYDEAIQIIEACLIKKKNGTVITPDKISMIFDTSSDSRINCMPGTLIDDKISGVKWISVFPNNPQIGYRNVSGIMILSEIEHGHTLSIMDASFLTDLRTAAIGATAAKYLSKEDSYSIGFIGAGQQARRHLDLIKIVRPNLKKCYVSSRTDKTAQEFIVEESNLHPDMDFIFCGNDYESSVCNADIVVTAISAQKDILKASWIKKGALYIHVAGYEDEYAVAKKANKIVCDDWESVKHRTQTISRMYKEHILNDSDIYCNLEEIISGEKTGRENNEEFIYFCSVGMAIIDVSFAKHIYDKCKSTGVGTYFKFHNP